MKRLQAVVVQLRLPVSLVVGESKNGGRLCFLFVGREAFSLYLSDLVFKKPPQVEQEGMVFVWRLKHIPNGVSSDVDAVLVSCDRFYKRWLEKAGLFVFPHFVDMVLDTSKDLKELIHGLSHSTKDDVRKVNKNVFSFEISSNISKMKTFYVDMYLPTLKNRVGETDVFIPDFVFLKYLQKSGYELMVISHKGIEVCGVLFEQKDDMMMLRYAGVLHGDTDLIKKGAFSAFYYFFMIYAKDQKVNKVDFGGTRPFFDDGLFEYKRKWGMRVELYDLVKEIFGLRIVSEPGSLKQFLINNPFIGMNEKNDLTGFIFVDKKTFTDTMRNQAEKRFQTPGVNELRFIEL